MQPCTVREWAFGEHVLEGLAARAAGDLFLSVCASGKTSFASETSMIATSDCELEISVIYLAG